MYKKVVRIVFYINVKGLAPKRIHDKITEFMNMYKPEKIEGEIEKHYFIPVTEHDSKVEVLTPNMDVEAIEEKFEKILNELKIN